MSQVALSILVFLFSVLPASVFADGAVLRISPEQAAHAMGEKFDVQVLVDTGGIPVNAAEADIEFNPTALSVERVSTQDSLLTLWPTAPYFSNEEGVVKFSGLMEGTFAGERGLLLTITFKALRNMTSNARLAAGAILAADGQGSNIITGMKSGVFTTRPREIEEASNVDAIPSVPTEEPTLVRPVFQPHDDVLASGDYISLGGIAPPNSQISVWVQKGGGEEVRTDVMSTSDGFFSFVSAQSVTEGVYRVRAAVREVGGTWGPSSDHIRITVRDSGLVASALFGITVLTDLIPFLGLLVLGGLGVGYLLHKHKIAKIERGIQ